MGDDRPISIGVVLFVGIQVAIPLVMLVARLTSGKCMPFGWQMYSCLPA